jgi:hypothetical protein
MEKDDEMRMVEDVEREGEREWSGRRLKERMKMELKEDEEG